MKTVRIIDYHRNGVGGLGFHVAIVDEVEDGVKREMLVVRLGHRMNDADAGGVLCCAFDLSKLDQREIRFFHNSWRGDHYVNAMDKAIANMEKELG